MVNVKHEIKGNKLVIVVDVSTRMIDAAVPSKTGKTKIVGSTNGFISLNGSRLAMSVNVVTR